MVKPLCIFCRGPDDAVVDALNIEPWEIETFSKCRLCEDPEKIVNDIVMPREMRQMILGEMAGENGPWPEESFYFETKPVPLNKIIPCLGELEKDARQSKRELRPEDLPAVRQSFDEFNRLSPYLLNDVSGVAPEDRGIEVTETKGFMNRIDFYKSDVIEMRAHLFALHPRGEEWIHSHDKSFASKIISGGYTHDLWALDTVTEVCNPQIPHSISLHDQVLVAVEPGQRFQEANCDALTTLDVRVYERTAGVGGGFRELEDSAQQAQRIFRHKRNAGELLYLHRDAHHTVKASQDNSSIPEERLITLILRVKTPQPEERKATRFYVDASDERMPSSEDTVTKIDKIHAQETLEHYIAACSRQNAPQVGT